MTDENWILSLMQTAAVAVFRQSSYTQHIPYDKCMLLFAVLRYQTAVVNIELKFFCLWNSTNQVKVKIEN